MIERYLYLSIYLYIYIYRERERERIREWEREREGGVRRPRARHRPKEIRGEEVRALALRMRSRAVNKDCGGDCASSGEEGTLYRSTTGSEPLMKGKARNGAKGEHARLHNGATRRTSKGDGVEEDLSGDRILKLMLLRLPPPPPRTGLLALERSRMGLLQETLTSSAEES